MPERRCLDQQGGEQAAAGVAGGCGGRRQPDQAQRQIWRRRADS